MLLTDRFLRFSTGASGCYSRLVVIRLELIFSYRIIISNYSNTNQGMISKPRSLRCVPFNVTNRFSTSPQSQTLELKFDHYAVAEPVNNSNDRSKQPIIILHGLFGSKRNYRSISK